MKETRNSILSSSLPSTPSHRRSIRMIGAIHPDSVQIVPGTSFLVALLEASNGESREVVVVDLYGGVIGRKAVETEAQECSLAVDSSGFDGFKVALLWEKDRNQCVICVR